MREEAVVVLRLDTGDLPAKSQQAAASLKAIGATGEISARQTAAAMRQLPAQLTDVATQLAGGANPLLVLLQQGGQVKDLFGGIGPAIRGIGAAITPAALGIGAVAAAVGTLALASYKGAQQDKELRDSLLLTGNAAGLTASRVQLLAEQTAASSRQTVGGAREIVMALAASGQVSGRVIDAQAQAVARLADVSGQDAKKIAADFASMGNGVAKWAAEHNKAWNFITVEQYRYIRRLEEQGRAEQAMIEVSNAVSRRLEGQKANLGLVERAWDGITSAASRAWQAMLGAGREETTRERLDRALVALSRLHPIEKDIRRELEQRVQLLKEQLRLENQQADAQGRNAAATRRDIQEERAQEGKPKPEFGAIRTAREQYRADFLRSEKAFYGELEKLRQDEAEAARKDPLGEFITERVLPEDQRRQDARINQNAGFLQQLIDQNARYGVDLIDDERARGEALIVLERSIGQRRLQEAGLTGDARAEAERLLDEQALARRRLLETELQRSNDRIAEDAGKQTYGEVRGALMEAFRDTRNPVQAFARTLGAAVYSRLTAAIADSMATAMVGADGRGGWFGAFVSLIGGMQGGGLAVDTAGYGIGSGRTDGQVGLPTRGGMASGTNFVPRDMIVKVHRGEAIVPARYNPATGAQPAAQATRPQTVVNLTLNGPVPAEQVALVEAAVNRAMLRHQRRAAAWG